MMDYQSKFSNDFAEYLNSMVKLDELQKMTENLDQELKDSQSVLNEIKNVFDNLPTANVQSCNSGQDNVSQILAADVPKLLFPGETKTTNDIDLDRLIATMRLYVEDLKKNFAVPEPREQQAPPPIDNLDLTPYASSLDQLVKQISKMKLSAPETQRNDELEAKLNHLCQDVNLFTQMVEAKTKLSETNKNWAPIQQENLSLCYDDMISNLLSRINEVTYLLKTKN
ncbi:uncharacterized protein LOC121729721 [Aricia agestis]|uniref:uncharacterized protein LOC121729721 n=1 Tax=Aricia agestis TaxID=91739 RepID=UPI001C205266|nr:uncharacterized protein LOC121729721 [Aricia agestis]